MKTAINVFLYLSYIGAGLNVWDAIDYFSKDNAAIGLALLVNAFIVTAVALLAQKKLATATCKRDLRGIAIITLLFSNLVAGILMLCIPETAFATPTQHYNPYTNPYGNPYNSPYGAPYGTQQNQSPYGSPYGNPTGTPFTSQKEEESDETDQNNEQDT